ncbi:MAG: hypothetical protein V4792_05510 [Pseudomonadota bacterium]
MNTPDLLLSASAAGVPLLLCYGAFRGPRLLGWLGLLPELALAACITVAVPPPAQEGESNPVSSEPLPDAGDVSPRQVH